MKNFITTVMFFLIASFAIAQGSIDSGLVAFYPFNGNANDLSGNGHDGTINGNATLVPDRFNSQNKAYTFPDQSSSISLANSVNMNLETGFTINAWIKYKSGGTKIIVCKHVCGFVNGFLFGIDTDGQIQLWLGQSGWSTVRTNQTFIEDQWYMVTATYDSASSLGKVYVDGELGGSGNVAYNNFSSNPISIGESYQNNCVAGNMDGAVDEVKIYTRPLSDTEILDEYNNTYTDLVLFLPFNGNANDESGSENNGTVNGASLVTDRFGVEDHAYQFNGASDFISVANSNSITLTDEITLSAWVKRTRFETDIILEKGEDWTTGTTNYGLSLHYIYNNMFYFFFNGGWRGTSGVSDFEWHHYAAVINNGDPNPKLYIDGVLKTIEYQDGAALINLYPSNNDLHIGAQLGTYTAYSANLIDDIRIYNRNLSDDEINLLYNDSTTYNPQLISSVYPLQNSNNYLFNESIKIYFTEPMNEATFNYNSVSTFGNLTGSYELSFAYQSSNNSLEITPTVPFKYGEQITVTLDSTIQSLSGYNLSPYVFQFNVKPEKGSVNFAVADSFQLNFPPTNIVSGDFNNDNKIDVIVSNYDSSKYTILLNNGSGGFTLGEEMTGEFKPYSISLTDIDSDRDLDMIVSTNEQNQIRLLRGSGQGIFSWILPTISANAPIATCPGDFDGDGDNDFVALLNYANFDGRAYLYKNDGTGNFTESGYTYVGFPQSKRFVCGDVDNDGDLDLVVGQSDYNGIVRTLLNDGSGNFTYSSGSNLGAYPDEIAGGDIDGDYDLDVVHFSWYANGVGIMLNDGTGSYTGYQNLGNVGGQTRNPIVNDFDGDADLDFVGVFNGNNIGIVKNNTHPNYELSLSYPIAGLNGITAGDFDNNGSIDLVGITTTTNQVKFIKNCVDSLVAYFPLDGNANDESENINNGICYNVSGSTDRYGLINKALYFDSLTSYIEGINPGNNLPEKNSPRSFSAWVKAYSYDDFGNDIFNYGAASMSPTNFRFFVRAQITIGNGDYSPGVSGNSNIIDSTWHFVTGVYEGGTEHIASLYVDGIFENSGAITVEPYTLLESNWMIGRFMLGDVRFNGVIDELKVFNFALTNQQVWDMYKATTTAPTLLFPGNDSTLINPTMIGLVLDWDSTVTASSYRLLIANDSLFNTVIHDTIVSTSSFNFYDWFSVNIDNLYWKVRTINDGGIGPWSETNRFNIILTDVEDEAQLPTKFALMQNYPNPFNPNTTITYHLPKTTNVLLKVYDVLGNEIATLVNEEKPAGVYNVEFGSKSSMLSSGIYFYQIKAGNYLETKKMIYLK